MLLSSKPMPRRTLSAAVLVAFVLATGLQLLLHAHLTEERHHAPGCDADHASIAHTHPLAGHPGAGFVPAPETDPAAAPPHDHCARCVNAIGDLRVLPAALDAPRADRHDALPR